MYVPKAGTIKAVYIYWHIGTPATPDLGWERALFDIFLELRGIQ